MTNHRMLCVCTACCGGITPELHEAGCSRSQHAVTGREAQMPRCSAHAFILTSATLLVAWISSRFPHLCGSPFPSRLSVSAVCRDPEF